VRAIETLFGLTVASILMATAAVAADAVAPAAPAAGPDRMQQTICRRDKETGSLVKSHKTCHTRAQWEYIDDTNQAFSRNLVDDTRGKMNGN
jgi:ActR/RegA family two-component response regulator